MTATPAPAESLPVPPLWPEIACRLYVKLLEDGAACWTKLLWPPAVFDPRPAQQAMQDCLEAWSASWNTVLVGASNRAAPDCRNAPCDEVVAAHLLD